MYKYLKFFLVSFLFLNFINLKADTIKVGVLHSLSGTMAISETTLKDTVLMLIEKQNKAGGLLGKKLEAVVVDPASDWPLFAEKAKELLTVQKVDVVFGCWTSRIHDIFCNSSLLFSSFCVLSNECVLGSCYDTREKSSCH